MRCKKERSDAALYMDRPASVLQFIYLFNFKDERLLLLPNFYHRPYFLDFLLLIFSGFGLTTLYLYFNSITKTEYSSPAETLLMLSQLE